MTPADDAALEAAKVAYQEKLRSCWVDLHDDAEADFEAGYAAAAAGEPRNDAVAAFTELIGDDPLSDLRLEDFQGGFATYRALVNAA